MDLRQLLETDVSNLARTDEEVASWLKQTVAIPDSQRVDMRAILSRLTITQARSVIVTLRTAAALDVVVEEALTQIRGDGLDLTDENAVQMIDLLFTDPQLCSAVKALANRSVQRFTLAGLSPMDDASLLYWVTKAREPA